MNYAVITNLLALGLSMMALAVSVVVAVRQIAIMRHTNQASILVGLGQEYRSIDFQHAQDYIVHKLKAECEADLGCSGLPDQARMSVGIVTTFYSGLGSLVALKIENEALVISIFGFRANQAWTILEPYIARERILRGDGDYLGFFEDLVYRTRMNWPPKSAYRLSLGTIPYKDSNEDRE